MTFDSGEGPILRALLMQVKDARFYEMTGPGDQTNWVVKGHVLCGPHPGRLSTTDLVRNLTALLRAGVKKELLKAWCKDPQVLLRTAPSRALAPATRRAAHAHAHAQPFAGAAGLPACLLPTSNPVHPRDVPRPPCALRWRSTAR